MTRHVIPSQTIEERLEVRIKALQNAREVINAQLEEAGNKAFDLQPRTIEHETNQLLSTVLQLAREELERRSNEVFINLHYYTMGKTEKEKEADTHG